MCAEVEIANVCSHKFCTFGGDDIIEQHFYHQHVSSVCSYISQIANLIANKGEPCLVWFDLALSGPIVHTNFPLVTSLNLFAGVSSLLIKQCVSAFYPVFHSLYQSAKFVCL